jgi:hypothetical protein
VIGEPSRRDRWSRRTEQGRQGDGVRWRAVRRMAGATRGVCELPASTVGNGGSNEGERTKGGEERGGEEGEERRGGERGGEVRCGQHAEGEGPRHE